MRTRQEEPLEACPKGKPPRRCEALYCRYPIACDPVPPRSCRLPEKAMGHRSGHSVDPIGFYCVPTCTAMHHPRYSCQRRPHPSLRRPDPWGGLASDFPVGLIKPDRFRFDIHLARVPNPFGFIVRRKRFIPLYYGSSFSYIAATLALTKAQYGIYAGPELVSS